MKRRAIAICLSFILTVTGIVAALPVMVNFASADLPEEDGYLDDLFSEMRSVCPAGSLTQFDYVHQQLSENFDSWLIMIEHKLGSDDWVVSSYSPDQAILFYYTFYNGEYLFRPRYTTDYYNYNFYSRYGFMIKNGQFYNEPYNTGLGNTNFTSGVLSSTDYWQWWYCTPSDVDDQRYDCWTNQDLRMLRQNGDWGNNSDYIVYFSSNLLNGTYTPPIIDFHWFKFQLGQRWYVTTFDQSLVAAMETGDDTFWVWAFDKYLYSQEEPVTEILTWSDMQYLPGAVQFIGQTVTNISVNGILAYDITDLVLSGDVIQFALSQFYQVIDSPTGMILGNVMASSEDIISLVITPEEENESQNNAWDNISDYMENYPSVTISPQALAEQVFGTRAYTGSMGVIQMPYPVYAWSRDHYPNDVSNEDNGNLNIDGYWHFRLDGSGIDSYSFSMINWSICNACIIPAPKDTWLNNQLGIDSYAFPVYWWNASDQLISDATFLGTFPVEYIFEMFDIVIFAPDDAVYLADFDSTLHSPGTIGFCNLNYDTTIGPANGSAKQTVFICSTDKVLYKSELYVFCDSQSKLYDLLSVYIQKRDLWDESFLKWSLSVFWELETINGHLSSIDTTLSKWNFKDWFQDLSDKLSQIVDNTSETQEPMWYESLWNWVRKFTPSDNAFTNGLNAIETGLDNIPDIALPTHYPDYPLLPTFTPTPVPIEGS